MFALIVKLMFAIAFNVQLVTLYFKCVVFMFLF